MVPPAASILGSLDSQASCTAKSPPTCPGALYQMGAVAGRLPRAGQHGGGTAGVDTFLLLAPVTEPDADHFLLHVQLLGDQQDLL